MASSDPMDDGSFRSRVHRIFGSLSSSSSPSPISPAPKPLWSLTDEEVEKREWNRSEKPGKDDDNTICASSFDEMLKRNRGSRRKGFDGDLEDLSGDEDDNSTDVLEIRSSIGLDSTLDNEEEEDEFDRLAEGKEKTRKHIRRDPRADKLAAQVRLQEDASDAAKYEPNNSETEPSGEKHESTAISDDHSRLKPILKRQGNADAKSSKRVRFDPSFVEESQETTERHRVFSELSSSKDNKEQENNPLCDENKPKVPDHITNPSKYTHYSLDSCSDLDDESNNLACSSVLEEVKKWDPSSTLPKSVSFVPKKKTSSCMVEDDVGEEASKEFMNQQNFPISISAWEAQSGEEDDMQMDMEDDDTGVSKPDRQYRNKSRVEDPVT